MKLSFEDCPYGCVDGKIFNSGLKRVEDCPYCAEKRKKAVQEVSSTEEKNIFDELKINEYYRGLDYTFDNVLINEGYLVEDSLKEVKDSLDLVYGNLSIGEIPNETLMYNLGGKANVFAFVYPFMLRAYKFGFSITPLLGNTDIVNAVYNLEHDYTREYTDYIERDLSVVLLSSGITYLGVRAVKGYVQDRAMRGKATIIFSQGVVEKHILNLVSETGNGGLHLARLISVRYVKGSEDREPAPVVNENGSRVIQMEDLMAMGKLQ